MNGIKPGRGFRGLREEVVMECDGRDGVEDLLGKLNELVGGGYQRGASSNPFEQETKGNNEADYRHRSVLPLDPSPSVTF